MERRKRKHNMVKKVKDEQVKWKESALPPPPPPFFQEEMNSRADFKAGCRTNTVTATEPRLNTGLTGLARVKIVQHAPSAHDAE